MPLETVNTEYLRSSGRNAEVPFSLFLESEGSTTELVCEQIIRIIQGKRLVCLGKWNDKPVVAKIFLNSKSAKRHFGREIKGINALKNAGIKTPALLLQGNLLQDGTPVLVFERIIPAHNPQEAVLRAETDEKRSELLKQISVVIAEQHEAGLKQKDLHLGNFLLADNDIYTIDGNTVDTRQMGTALPKAKSVKNLGLYFAQFDPKFDHLFFSAFQAYAAKRSWPSDNNLFKQLLKELRHHRNHRKRNYLHKIFRECTAFVCHKSWNRFMVCDRNFYYGEMKKLIADPDFVIDSGRLLKNGNSATVALVEVNNKLLVVKRHNIKNFIHALKRSPRNTRAWSSWRNAHRLESLGIPTPKPIAFLEKRWGPFRSTAYYITEYVDGTDLYHLITSDRSEEINIEVISKRFGGILQSIANASISHGDFKATNFIVTEDSLFIIDIEGMCEHICRWSLRRALKRDCTRFMKNWADVPEIAKIFKKNWNFLNKLSA